MSAELTLICRKCSFPIAGDMGCLRVSFEAIREHARREREWKADHPAGSAVDINDFLLGPDEIRWEAYHDACDPAKGDDCYQIDAVQLTTWQGVCRWTAHLMDKNWFPSTDWDHLLRELAGEIPATTIRILERSA